MGRRRISRRAVVFLAVVTMLAVGCGGGGGGATEGGGGGGQPAAPGLEGAQIRVGSKEFTEQLILGQIALQVLENAGAQVTDETGLVGSSTVRQALTRGEIDMYWEYTGTGWITHLGNTAPIVDMQEQYQAVADADAANGLVWLPPAPLDNTYAIATSAANADAKGLRTLSDVAALPPEEQTFCGAAEFLGRDDGLPGVIETYGLATTPAQISELELGLIPNAVSNGEPCQFGEVFATDGRIQALNLRVLEDNLNFFPRYNASLVVRQQTMDQYPQIAELFAPVSQALTTEEAVRLNAQVDVEGQVPEVVAQQWLEEKGLLN